MSKLYYDLTLDDGEMLALDAALSRYLAVCEREIANGVNVPFFAHKETLEGILSRLFDKIHTSKGLLSAKQLQEMARAGQAPEEFYDV
jgi:hypothetical protein